MVLMLDQIGRWLMQPQIWRFVCFASSVTGLVCYALSSSFNLLFGEWNMLKILFYTVFCFMFCLAILFAKAWQQNTHPTGLLCKAHLSVVVLTATSVYSFFYDRAVNTKPDAFSLISSSAFSIMSLGLSRQTHFGFEVDLLYFFLGCLMLQLMKIKLLLGIVGACFSYFLVIFRSMLQNHEDVVHSQQANTDIGFVTDMLDPDSGNGTNIVLSDMGLGTTLKHVLVACAKAIADTDLIMTRWLIQKSREMVSVSGEPMQRLGAYVLEALVARLAHSGSSIYKALKPFEPTDANLLSYTHIFYQICPYIKFGYISANGVIAEAMKDQDKNSYN
ncbi:hypothetical protein RJT34_10676 [Clitoria ternatea]|uniref:Exocyst subunit Exo70 family protein n=1 Tax=Clitoria ternatea TaxID=43366 RepID=A0AAN9JLA6_CLITE